VDNIKVILIFPKTGQDKTISLSPPYAILSIASQLNPRYQVIVIDQRIHHNWKNRIRKNISEDCIIGISSFTGAQIKYGLEISEFCKNLNPNIKIVWGGIHPTLMPNQTLQNKYIDIIVRGEGEITFPKLVECLAKQTKLKTIKGISFKQNGKIIHNTGREFADMNKFKQLRWNLVNINDYVHKASVIEGTGKTFDIGQTSRGCINNCKFCVNSCYNKSQWRCFSAKRTLKLIIDSVNMLDIKTIWLRDDNFFLDTKRVKTIAQGIIKEKLDISWYSSGITIPNYKKMDKNLKKLAYKSGCRSFRFGIESGSPRILKLINKPFNLQDIHNTNNNLKKYNISPKYSYMCGFPTETKSDLLMTVKLMHKLKKENKKAENYPMTMYMPYPGTELFDLSIQHGFKAPRKLKQWSQGIHFMSKNLNRLEYIDKDVKKILNNVSDLSYINSMQIKRALSGKLNKALMPFYAFEKFRWNNLLFSFAPELWLYRKTRNILLGMN